MDKDVSYAVVGHRIDASLVKRYPENDGVFDETGELRVFPAQFWRDMYSKEELCAFCVRNGIYGIPTTELRDWLVDRIAGRKAIEIAAGNGVLAKALGISATDSMQQLSPDMIEYYAAIGQGLVKYGPHVKPMAADRAMRALKPQVVIGMWVTHKFRYSEEWRNGNVRGVEEEKIVAVADYIFIGNEEVHRFKPILELEHEQYTFPWLVSRAYNGSANFIRVWKKGAKAVL